MRKLKKTLNYVFGGLAGFYCLILLLPQMVFSSKFNHKNFIVYYHSEKVNADQLASVLDQSLGLLKTSDVFSPEKKQKIFLCDSFYEFAFFAPRSRNSFGVNYPLVQNIFLSPSNATKNIIKRNGSQNNTRTLSGVIAHETTHSLLEDKLGLLKYKLLPSWKNEGYCDYIAKESSYDELLGWTRICENKKEPHSPSYAYFRYKTYVEYLLEGEKNVSFNQFLEEDYEAESLAFRSRKKYCTESKESAK